MKFADPLALKYYGDKQITLFAASQLQGARPRQEDYFINYNDECFVVTDGVGGLPHGDVAAKLGADTAIWGYKLIRQRHYYWGEKVRLLGRIVRSSNIAVWQKQREEGFGDGLATTLLLLITGKGKFWLANVGDSPAFLLRRGKLSKITRDDLDENGVLTQALGTQRYGLTPHTVVNSFFDGDTILLCTDGVGRYVPEKDMLTILGNAGASNESLTSSIDTLFKTAKNNGSTDNMTACIVKRIINK